MVARQSGSTNRYVWFGVVLISLLVALFRTIQDVPIRQLERSDFDTSYNLVDLDAPAVAGPMLNIVSWIVTRSFLSPFLLRSLLNKNGVHLIRELAASPACIHLPPTHYPVHRVTNPQDMKYARDLSQAHDRFLQEGIEMEPKASVPYRSIMDYNRLYRSGKATASEVMEQVIEGARKLEHLHIFSSFLPENILEQAQRSDERWKKGRPLSVWDGVPVTIKDMSPVEGFPLCRGSSQCLKDVDYDDYPAQIFRRAGAIIVGITSMVEGGVSPLGYSVAFDGPFNPFDEDYYAGGSSGGSAVAVATGLVPVALGWDGGGSVRVPASMSGTLGLATTFGRVAYEFSSTSTMIKAGPLAATMVDIALSHLLLGQIQLNSFVTKLIGEAYLPPPHLDSVVVLGEHEPGHTDPSSLKGTRLGVYWDHFKHTDAEVYEASLKSVHFLERQGAAIVNITIPHLRELHLSHGLKIMSEFGVVWEGPFFQPDYQLEGSTEITIALGRTVTATEVLAAEKLRTYGLRLVCEDLFRKQKLDAIVSPMLGNRVPKPRPGYRGYGESDTALMFKTMRFVPLANLLGLPGLVVPVGYEKATGLPIGFQILGDAWTEHKLIRIGSVLEESTRRRRPPSRNFFDPLGKFF